MGGRSAVLFIYDLNLNASLLSECETPSRALSSPALCAKKKLFSTDFTWSNKGEINICERGVLCFFSTYRPKFISNIFSIYQEVSVSLLLTVTEGFRCLSDL